MRNRISFNFEDKIIKMSRVFISMFLAMAVLGTALGQQGKPVEFREEIFDFGTIAEEEVQCSTSSFLQTIAADT